MVLELNDREQEILKRALNTFEEELRTVIVKTDKRELREDLRGDEVVVKKILEKITWH
jgi:TRAP-type C4-dicarboxylate transport system substrate-binding protein